MPRLYCERCDHEWWGRPSRWSEGFPIRCPNCWIRGGLWVLDKNGEPDPDYEYDTATPKEAETS